MVASQVHLVRHGEVFNPDGILYGRLSGFGLSELGHRMAQAAAGDLSSRARPVTALASSPLQRTRESAAPIAEAFGLEPRVDERLIEPTNRFEGSVTTRAMRLPRNWPFLVNPWRPSWGEAYAKIAARMHDALDAAFDEVADGDVVLVSHQLPIWALHLSLTGERFMHDPRRRRCSLSSITTFERRDGELVEVGYTEPALELQHGARDVGAV
ncbi:histidine phosphatase family protein [Microbacterium sp. STN6]|uniref:histidine phosphatase family protein n=1 Tax=Microbacterium sp. STN6 TaxID=2995588 RepID=UPI002260CEF2|nr:histidine phosphatase family protein [Microbacterium sp. STN6]MCX7520675.1 histidine phosphatase family protein [Microbacterium sp. STN6]